MKTHTKTTLSRHSTAYYAMRPFWSDCLNLKEPLTAGSTVAGLAPYLNRYAKEDDGEFSERSKRLAQVNFLDLVVDAYCSMLFSTDMRVTSIAYEDEVQGFVRHCNPQGDTLWEYLREQVAPAALSYGTADVFTDLPQSDQEVVSKAQQDEAGLKQPYCYMVPPLNRVNWELDDTKAYTLYRSEDVINTQIAAQMSIRDRRQYNEWTPEDVTKYASNGTVLETRPNPFGFIPAVTFMPLPSMRFYDDRIGLSLVQDVVPLQKLILNLISLILDFHESVNFGMRVLIQDEGETGDLEPPTQGELAEGGNRRGIILKGKGSRLDIVTPDATGVEAMCRFLDQLIERVFQSVRIPSDANVNKTHQSSGTIRGNMAPLYTRLTRMSKHFEKTTRQLIEMALKVQGIDPADAGVQVQWGTNFSFESFITAIEELTALRSVAQDITPTAVAEITRKTVGSQIYDTEKTDAVNKEIDEWVKRTKEAPVLPQAVGKKPKGKTARAAADPGADLPTLQKQNTEVAAAEKVEAVEGE